MSLDTWTCWCAKVMCGFVVYYASLIINGTWPLGVLPTEAENCRSVTSTIPRSDLQKLNHRVQEVQSDVEHLCTCGAF